jgi:hypothetical protein
MTDLIDVTQLADGQLVLTFAGEITDVDGEITVTLDAADVARLKAEIDG